MATRNSPKPRPVTNKSRIVAIVSDIHFDLHDKAVWRAFRKWHTNVRPFQTIMLGDVVDLGMLSRFAPGENDPTNAIDQIKVFVQEANALVRECGSLLVMEGNHDERFEKITKGANPTLLKGAKGLGFSDQCYAQGLSRSVQFLRESTRFLGTHVGQFLLRHGHKQSNKFGAAKYLAGNHLDKSMGQSEVFGHHHRLDLAVRSAFGRTAVAIANPCMVVDQEYHLNPGWSRGFTILELDAPNYKRATPHPILMENGVFSWGGITYDGNC